MTQFRGVILDVDGTLVDSNDAHTRSWIQAMADYGYYVSYDKVRPLIGMGGDKVLPEVLAIQKESLEGEKISAKRADIFKQRYMPGLSAFSGAQELLRHMREQHLKLAVASSAQPDELKKLLQIVGASDLVEEESSAKDASQSKPDPDVVQAALQKMGMQASEVVMLGDTPFDIEAARKAGVATIALRCGGWHDNELTGAIAVYDDPADLLAHYDTSPLENRQNLAS